MRASAEVLHRESPVVVSQRRGGGRNKILGNCSDPSTLSHKPRVRGKWSSARLYLMTFMGVALIGWFRIESIMYKGFRENTTRRAEEEHAVVAKALRHSTSSSGGDNRNTGYYQKKYDKNIEYEEPMNYLYGTNEDLRGPGEGIISRGANLPIPRTVAIDERMKLVPMGSVTTKVRTAKKMELETVAVNNEDNHYGRFDFERPFYEQCEPLLKPFPRTHPTCNNIHELAIATTSENESFLLSMKGSWRSVWKVSLDTKSKNTTELKQNEKLRALRSNTTTRRPETSTKIRSSSSSAVLKMLHLHRQFDNQSFEAHATDIIVMDLLTASPYVVDAYGFCGQSVLTEFADSSGRDYVKRYDIGSRDRMKVARDLARGLSDIQALRALPHVAMVTDTSNSSVARGYDVDSRDEKAAIVFAHNDITIANTVMVSGKIKWNDFNIGVFMRKKRIDSKPDLLNYASSNSRHQSPPNPRSKNGNSDAHETNALVPLFKAFTDQNIDYNQHLCPAPVKFRSDMWRSPEEIRNTSYVQMTLSDMYGLGNILYQTMTRHQPWTYKEPGGALTKADVALRKLNGTIPTIPEQYLNTTKRELQSLFAATNLCLFPDPWKRPTARRLAYGLGSLYNRLKHKERVSRQMILDYLLPPKLPT